MSKLPDLSISDGNKDITASSHRYRGTSEYLNYAPLTEKVRIYKGNKKTTTAGENLVLNPGSGLGQYANQTNESFFSVKSTKNSNLGYDSPMIRNRQVTTRSKGKTN